MSDRDRYPHDRSRLREQVMGCWLGKAIGGTLGQSFEGLDGPLDVSFYQPVPETMEPNDDLDLQVVWACHLAAMDQPVVDRHTLAQAWLRHIGYSVNEYGVAKRNLREGIAPPASGAFDNWFSCGEGAAIRSEIWACLAPGDPERAAAYAYEDACVDHAGDGIAAAQFLAAMQSQAFLGGDVDRLIDVGLAAINRDCELYQAVTATRKWVASGMDWLSVRARILDEFGVEDFTDVRMNTAFVVLGLLVGAGDFETSIVVTNNCGKDTDSSTASVGATLGILHPEAIPDRWLRPIGRDLVLNVATPALPHRGVIGVAAPGSLDEFTELVVDLSDRVSYETPERIDMPEVSRPVPVQACFYSLAGDYVQILNWYMPAATSPAPEWPSSPHRRELPGTWVRMPAEAFEDELLMLRYQVDAGDVQRVRIMVATDLDCRVWMDQEWLFGRDGGPMYPAPHIPRLNQHADIDLASGPHKLTIVLRRPPVGRTGEWVVGVADAHSKEWIPNALRPSNP